MAPGSAEADVAESPGAMSDVDRMLLRDELNEALATIGPDHRRAVVETILRDRPYAEVAAEFGIPAGTVRTRVYYGLRRLRSVLENAA